MKSASTVVNKTLYAILFLLVIPILLIYWAQGTEELINIDIKESVDIGWWLVIGGVCLMIWAMYFLWRRGKGLPMNAYPPERLVSSGPYRIFRHPIYVGFVLAVAGYFITIDSDSGLWLVTPIVVISIIALVLGYESLDLKRRFEDETFETIFDLPVDRKEAAQLSRKAASLLWIALCLFGGNYVVINLTDVTEPLLGQPLSISVPLTEIQLFLSQLILVMATPFILKREDHLRRWLIGSILGFGILVFIAVLLPEVGAQYLHVGSEHVWVVPVFLILLCINFIFKTSKVLGALFGVLAIALITLELAYSHSAALHIFSGLLTFLLVINYFRIWILLKNTSEKIANSWKEWVFGKVRIINHGFYVGFGSFLGIFITGMLVGDEYAWAILVFTLIVIIFSALWAQLIEGSEKLKRPYGYYGALVGIIFASMSVWVMGFEPWVLIGAISVVMPWVQAIGRFRCLVNGCCHGAHIDDPNVGIKYFHHRSRVCGISNLTGQLLHPTPLYSIIWLFLVGFILLKLWNLELSPPFIFGLYLILTGVGRFVEEAYRGEVQTPILKGLRLYQWTAILTVVIGIGMTLINVQIDLGIIHFGWQTFISALIGGLFTTFAMGVDFPESNARFSRLV